MEPFTPNQWVVLILVFLLGLLLGMFLLAGNKWKHRYREEKRLREEEVKRREELERHQKHWEAEKIAARARDDRPPPTT